MTLSPSRRSTIVVASKRSSTWLVAELRDWLSRTSNSVPAGTSRPVLPRDDPVDVVLVPVVLAGFAARPGAEIVDAIAQVEVVGTRNRFVLPQLHADVGHVVAKIAQLGLEFRGKCGVTRVCARDVATGIGERVLQTLDVRLCHVLSLGSGAARHGHAEQQGQHADLSEKLHEIPPWLTTARLVPNI